ncbi:ParA family protein [Brevibacterium daeguense]|uniref:ParA family protein n=1 Tax=Brevibacterium daeguense TaxID=909936 RepID=A0ABP8ENK7_9MICO
MLVLSISSLKGGVGKTSVTLGLASAAYSRGIPTLVVDVDPQADASTGLDVPVTTEVDIADVLAAPKSRILDKAVVPSGWVGDKPGHVDVIPGSPRSAEFDRPSLSDRYLRRLKEALAKVATGYRLVLIDCPPSLNGLTRAAWTASDRVLIVTEPGLFSVAAADRALRATDELRKRSAHDLQPLGIVVNRVRPNSREHAYRYSELKEMFGPLVMSPPLPERTVLQQAQGSARPIHSWPGKPAADLASSFDRILDRALRSENLKRSNRSAGRVGEPGQDAAQQSGSRTVNAGVRPGAETAETNPDGASSADPAEMGSLRDKPVSHGSTAR